MNSRNDTESDPDVMFVDVPTDDGADPLELFESESGPNQENDLTTFETKEAAPATTLTRTRRPIALDQVLHRLGGVRWEEAVAIVDGLSGILVSSGRDRVPEVPRIAITAAGGLVVGTGGVKDAAGPILARMLHTLAATGSLPAALRLFVTRWTAASDAHPIAEFARELAYFARPDGQDLIKAVYERAVATMPVSPAPPQEAARKAPPVRRPPARDSRLLYAGAAAVIVLGMVLTVHFASSGTGSAATTTARSDGIEAETNPPSAATIRGPGGRSVPGSATRATARPGTDRPARTTPDLLAGPGVNTGGSATSAPVSSAVRATLSSPAATSPRSSSPLPSSGAEASRDLEANPTRGARDVPDVPIYSRWDRDVTPPAFLQPQLPSPFLSGVQPETNTIEVIVAENGTVERVQLLSTPKRMADMMLLSGAKNWVFEPAVKDGRPVRYRLELSWAATP